MKSLLIFLFSIVLFLGACVNQSNWERVQAVDNQSWHEDKKYDFKYKSEDTSGVYNVYIDIRHTAQYKYCNLYLFVTTKAPNGQSIKDTLEFRLADTKGKWYGKGLSDVKQLRLKYKSGVKFAQSGDYIILVEQAMRDIELKYITDVGIRIVKN